MHRFVLAAALALALSSAASAQTAAAPAPAEPIAAKPADTKAADTKAADAKAAEQSSLKSGDAGDAALDEVTGHTDSGPQLKLYGFADFTYQRYLFDTQSGWAKYNIFENNGSLAVGKINLFLDGQLSQRARSLIEIRFSYVPNGTGSQLTSTGTQKVSTQVNDPTESNAYVSWGSILIERAWVEYAFSDLFTLRAGQFLTPVGIWNVDHASVALIDANQPYAITQQLFPRSQVGFEGYGSRYFGDTRLGWHLTVSNGRIESYNNDYNGHVPQYVDFDHRLGVGGRVFMETRGSLGELKVGGSFYTGRYTERNEGNGATGPFNNLIQQYDELSLGADVRWEYKSFLLQGEALYHDVKYTDDGRAAFAAFLGRPTYSDYTASGWYVLGGYRLPWYNIMPFGMFQHLTPNDTQERIELYVVNLGVNVRVLPNLVVKGSVGLPWWPKAPANDNIYGAQLITLQSQIAWAF
ncbi:MAG: hypothetical protein JST92_01360 [Deltaproteobacteria bacterium]|nr:hypothetical protein [Deltaproteobacteria bacterium]